MSTKKVAKSAFAERLLRLIDEKAMAKPSVFAKMTGIPGGTLYGYIEGRMPSSEHLVRIRDNLGVHIDWLLTGEGRPYFSPKNECAEEGISFYNLPEESVADEAIDEIPEILELAEKVLRSGNDQAAEALEKNIRYFAHAVEVEKRLENVERRLLLIEEALKRDAS